MSTDNNTHDSSGEERDGNLLRNILNLLLLVGILVAAWFVLDWLISK